MAERLRLHFANCRYEVTKVDKNEYNLRLEEIDAYVSQGNYSEAAKAADTIDWRRVRNVRTLCMISEIYEADHRYEDSKALLLRAYRRSPVGREMCIRDRLCGKPSLDFREKRGSTALPRVRKEGS